MRPQSSENHHALQTLAKTRVRDFNLEIKLRTQKQLEVRLLELLNRPANRLSDLLEIEKEVARVRGEVDELEGRKRFWDSQVAFSTLTVNVHEPQPLIAGDAGGVWQTLLGSFTEAGENFVLTIAGIIGAIGTLVPLAAAVLLMLFVLRVVWRRYRTRRSARATAV